jgi:polyferredoxin/YHS domain-containing protein
MKARLALLFPYLCALLVVGLLLWDHGKSDLTTAETERLLPEMPVAENGAHFDPVCLMEVGEQIELQLDGVSYYFCMDYCRAVFQEDPKSYLDELCLVCRCEGQLTPASEADLTVPWQGKTYAFCSEEHRQLFRDDPAGYFMHTMWGIPNWLYYASIALVLLLSFGIIEWKAKTPMAARPRIDLTQNVLLLRLLQHPLTRFTAQAITVILFLLILAAGLFGNQLPAKNIAPVVTWTIWWGGLIWLVLYTGKAWCYVCPWDAIAGWSESLRFWGKKKEGLSLGLKWPKVMANIWPATLLFIALTWLELGFGVTMKPRATAWIGLGMLGLAFVCAFLFDRKSFCRYGCLVGRISGLYALFSPIEIRSRDRDQCKTCRTHSCFKGNAAGEGCPTFQSLRVMDQSTYCILCAECLKTCEKENVALRLRPWGEDLVTGFRPRSDEAYLALIMLSLTGFHGLTMTSAWRDVLAWIEATLHLDETAAFTIGMTALMIAPGLLYAALVALSRWMAREKTLGYRDYFIRYAYALLPIALFYHIAHNSEHLLMEGQKAIALLSDPFGWEWNLFGTAQWNLPPMVSLPTLWIIQVFFVMIGHVYSLWIAHSVAVHLFPNPKTALRSQVPMLIAMILFSVLSLWLLKQPMEMRTSAM